MSSTGIAIGLNKGFPVTKLDKKIRPKHSKGLLGQRTKFVRALVREVVGLSPYERRLLDTLKLNLPGTDKKMYKMAKKRLGSHKRANNKREQIKTILSQMRMKQA
jgi:large subunit ribosomal protein L36e